MPAGIERVAHKDDIFTRPIKYDSSGDTALWSAGYSDEEYVREKGGWKIQKYLFTFHYLTEFDKGWAKENLATLG